MSHYQAPLTDMYFNLFDLWQTQKYWDESPDLKEMLDQDTASAILEEAAKLAAELIAPHSKLADQQGVRWNEGEVTTPEHYKTCYQQLCEGGWTGLSGDPEFGGMGMPKTLASMYEEMLCSADIAVLAMLEETAAPAPVVVDLLAEAPLQPYPYPATSVQACMLDRLCSQRSSERA